LLLRPLPDRASATLDDRDVEGLDAGFEDHFNILGNRCRRRTRVRERGSKWRCDFLDEALQGPPAPSANVGWDSRKRNDRTEFRAAADELERSDVVLYAFAVRSECRGLH
jgi:hypothetical protein